MTRGGRPKEADEPVRRCIVTRETAPAAGLIRFVVGPEGNVVPDLAGRLPGRGLWVSADRKSLEIAAGKGHFSRAAREKATVDPGFVDQIEGLLAQRLIDLIALARKSGRAVTGREKVLSALIGGDAAILLQASDGSTRERSGFRPPEGENTHVLSLAGAELGMAFGRDRVVHAAVLTGGLADRVKMEALRLSGVRCPNDRQTFGDGADESVAGEGPRGKG